MNILLATYWDYPHIGGVSSHMSLLADGLNKQKNNVYTIGGTGYTHQKTDDFIVRRKKKYNALAQKLIKIIDENQIDIVNAQDVLIAKGLQKANCKVPVVLTVHGCLTNESIADNVINKNSIEEKFLNDIEIESYKYVNRIIAVSSSVKKHIFSLSRRTATNMLNFVDVEMFDNVKSLREVSRDSIGIKENEKVILCAARLIEQKGIMYLLEAYKEIQKENKRTRLLIVGDGNQRERLEKYVMDNNLDTVVFTGNVHPQEMIRFYSSADLFIMPSITLNNAVEGPSIACLEAMAARIPVIASNIGGLRQIIKDGYNGVLVEEKNPKQLIEAIKYVFNNDNVSTIENAYQNVKNEHSHIIVSEKYMELYNKCVG